MLDPLNNIDLFCLPVITRRLTEFAAVHNNQAQSTAHKYSPMQLFHVNNKLLQFQNSDSSASINISDIVQQSMDRYRGTDFSAFLRGSNEA